MSTDALQAAVEAGKRAEAELAAKAVGSEEAAKESAASRGWSFDGGPGPVKADGTPAGNGSFQATLGGGITLYGNTLGELVTAIELWESSQDARKREFRSNVIPA